MNNYGQAILQGLGEYRQEQLAQEQLNRQNQLNPLGALGGLLGGALGAGMISKEAGPDWGKLWGKEALIGALSGGIQPVSGTGKDIFAGGVAGVTTAETLKALETERAMDILEKRKDILSNFDIVPEGTQGAFNISDVLPGIFSGKVFVKRKVANPILGIIGEQMGTNIPGILGATTPNEGDKATIAEIGKNVTFRGGKWVFDDNGMPVPLKYL